MDELLTHIISEHGAIATRHHLDLRQRIRTAVKHGDLVRVLPGVFAPDHSVQSRVAAATVHDPDCVIGGAAAAHLTWWPAVDVHHVSVHSQRQLEPAAGFSFTRGIVPVELIRELHPVRVAHPALSVIQMLPEHGPNAIDQALLARAIRVSDLKGALNLMPNVPGNVEARQWIEDSRDEPWSHLERTGHRALRSAGITGWQTNLAIQLSYGWIFVDIGFARYKLAVELDGWRYHNSFESFVKDRKRDVELVRRGWTVLRFTDSTIDDLVPAVTDVLRRLS